MFSVFYCFDVMMLKIKKPKKIYFNTFSIKKHFTPLYQTYKINAHLSF